MALEVNAYVPLATQSKFAFVVPEHYSVDVDTDAFPAANPGDFTPVRAWTKAEFEALYTRGS